MEDKNLTAIENIRQFKENWDGYGAGSFKNNLCEFLSSVIKSLGRDLQPKIFPTGRGSIQLEYEKENGEYLEFEIYSPERIEMLQVLENKEEIEKNIDLNEFYRLVREFHNM